MVAVFAALTQGSCERDAASAGDDRPILVMVRQDEKGRWVEMTAAVAGPWIPEGDLHGDELLPSVAAKDFVAHLTWRPSPHTPEGIKTRIGVTLLCSNHSGSCTNAGTLSLPDMTIEKERNPAWTVASGETVRPGNPPLILGIDIPEYPGRQSSNIRSAAGRRLTALSPPLAAGEVIELRASCYDWLGDGTLFIEAGVEREWQWPRPQPKILEFPADLDRNGLPDVLEEVERRLLPGK